LFWALSNYYNIMSSSPEVIIVGAGLSGLQAARSLANVGIRTVVLEARSRVGGTTWSLPNKDAGGVADLGAEWLNDTTQPRVYKLAVELGLEFSEVKVQGESILQGLDKSLTRHAYGEQAPVGSLSFKQWFQADYAAS
jgi:monoamine oxidase